MDKAFLEARLAEGMSLEKIGQLTGKHPSTVSYWLKKHGLEAEGKARHAPKAVLDPIRLRELVDSGATIREIADR
ncbi:MAG TPA: helix-turn-helix domain-containing protein, partial [Solirubrobacterales bacterium]|nr:helix-turn-helix domain-containing protein [Solirubrobacterales bacterium]